MSNDAKSAKVAEFLENLATASKSSLKVKIFGDGADKQTILNLNADPMIAGFTTNPTLMRKAGVDDYEQFARDVLACVKEKPISFEVFSDDFDEMEQQAREIATWGNNVNVKIPISNTKGESSVPMIERLCAAGIRLNVTAMTLYEQVTTVVPALSRGAGGYVSVFAGRIADSGRDPLPTMKKTMELLADHPNIELIWASPRELYNLVQADSINCHIITVTPDILKKLPLLNGCLRGVSLDTVRMFYNDAQSAGYKIRTKTPSQKQ
ncbi:MAG TPA: transaldolase [Candidatus Obscuribacterales bacterium]